MGLRYLACDGLGTDLLHIVVGTGAFNTNLSPPPIGYTALGDSLSSGTGSQPYFGVQACRRSYTSYALALTGLPTVRGNRIGAPIMRACHDAKIAEVYRPIHESASQFSCTRPLLNESELMLTKLELTRLYNEIMIRMPSNGYLFVLSYPQFFPNPDEGEVPDIVSCFGTNLTFSIEGLREIARATRQLRDAVQQAVAATNTGRVIFVDTIGVFRGHRICSEDPWANGFRFPELGGSFHPNARGHQAIAQRLYSLVSLFY